MNMAGELDDRWSSKSSGFMPLRRRGKPAATRGREESPDTMGNAPGNARGAVAQT